MDGGTRRRQDRGPTNAYHEEEVTVLTGSKKEGNGPSRIFTLPRRQWAALTLPDQQRLCSARIKCQ